MTRVSFDIEPGSITGLLGRNGAGKTTLLRIIAGQEFPTRGSVSVLDGSPVAPDHLLGRVVFIREDQRYPEYGVPGGFQVRHAFKAASWFYPGWDAELAEDLADAFTLPLRRSVRRLSRGMRSALGIVIGLAAQAEVTLFDEPYAGLDPVARQIFYDCLLADYAAHPRTMMLSTHLIDEAAGLFERVVVIDRGQIMLDAAADDVRGAAISVSGPAIGVEEFTTGRTVWNRRRIGGQQSAVVAGPLDDNDRVRFQMADGLAYTALPWGVLGINFLIWYIIAGSFGGGGAQIPAYSVCAIYLVNYFVGMFTIFRSLPFAFALGVSRRSYYSGTVLLGAGLAAIYGLLLTLLKVLEEVSDGWGVGLHFFRVSYILAGPWYLTWLTSFVGLTLMFMYGMSFGVVWRRWRLAGILAFSCTQVAALLIWVITVSSSHAWTGVGHFFTSLSAAGFTGLLAGATALLVAGGYGAMRRVTV